MKVIVFAGGHGLRLWPLSKKNSPKQFEKMFDGKSTLQLMIDRLLKQYNSDDIYISTNKNYKEIIEDQIEQVPAENIIFEPEKRDLAAAVGLSFAKVEATGYDGPISILWSDHLIEDVDRFLLLLKVGEELILEDSERFIFTGEKPRFANQNLGWISIGDKIDSRKSLDVHEFKGWVYRPNLENCQKMFEEGKSVWNPGYFITSIEFVQNLYKENMPEMYNQIQKIISSPERLEEIYPELESVHFDDAIVKKTRPEQAVVISVEIGWSDPGTLYALKEALQKAPNENIEQGNIVSYESEDCLIINRNDSQLVSTIGLDGFIIINLPDTLLVCHKDNIPDIKKLLEKLEKEGYDKYL